MQIKQKAKEIYEYMNVGDFKIIEFAIDYYSKAKNEEKRLYLGSIYNKMASIKHFVRVVDLTAEDASQQLDKLLQDYKQYKNIVRGFLDKRYSLFLSMKNQSYNFKEKCQPYKF